MVHLLHRLYGVDAPGRNHTGSVGRSVRRWVMCLNWLAASWSRVRCCRRPVLRRVCRCCLTGTCRRGYCRVEARPVAAPPTDRPPNTASRPGRSEYRQLLFTRAGTSHGPSGETVTEWTILALFLGSLICWFFARMSPKFHFYTLWLHLT